MPQWIKFAILTNISPLNIHSTIKNVYQWKKTQKISANAHIIMAV